MHELLVKGLGGLSLPKKSVVRLIDRPDMTLDVYPGRKTTTQQQQQLPTKRYFLLFCIRAVYRQRKEKGDSVIKMMCPKYDGPLTSATPSPTWQQK